MFSRRVTGPKTALLHACASPGTSRCFFRVMLPALTVTKPAVSAREPGRCSSCGPALQVFLKPRSDVTVKKSSPHLAVRVFAIFTGTRNAKKRRQQAPQRYGRKRTSINLAIAVQRPRAAHIRAAHGTMSSMIHKKASMASSRVHLLLFLSGCPCAKSNPAK